MFSKTTGGPQSPAKSHFKIKNMAPVNSKTPRDSFSGVCNLCSTFTNLSVDPYLICHINNKIDCLIIPDI